MKKLLLQIQINTDFMFFPSKIVIYGLRYRYEIWNIGFMISQRRLRKLNMLAMKVVKEDESHIWDDDKFTRPLLSSPQLITAEWWPSPSTINHIFKINDKHGILFCHISIIRPITARSNDPYHGLIKHKKFSISKSGNNG